MNTKTLIAAAGLCAVLGGCAQMTGRAEFAPLAGVKASETDLIRAKARCENDARDYTDRTLATGIWVSPEDIVGRTQRCMTAEGFALQGFRQPDGAMTARPWR